MGIGNTTQILLCQLQVQLLHISLLSASAKDPRLEQVKAPYPEGSAEAKDYAQGWIDLIDFYDPDKERDRPEYNSDASYHYKEGWRDAAVVWNKDCFYCPPL
ncbi:MAG: hypothetical protein KME06_05050 [Kastovskya adunca ATA6-11-RM4]|jgi:hypothetical protein|nr:hypothetical protein [Kastovskya adunca ATA6-11-RM4]